MSIYNYRNPLIYMQRRGTSQDPYQTIQQLCVVQQNRILLSEVPDELYRLQIKVKGYAKARFSFIVDEIDLTDDYKITISGQDYTIPKGKVKDILPALATSINGISNSVHATYYVATKSLEIIAKSEGAVGNMITVFTNTPSDIGKWTDTTGNNTSTLKNGSDSRADYYEIKNGFLKEKEFKVDYTFGYIELHESANGLIVEATYKGRGITFIPASRIYTKTDGYTVLETLQDYLDNVQDAFNKIDELQRNLIATGSFDLNRIYKKGNIVEYQGSGYMYVDENPSSGAIPNVYPDALKWKLVVKKGDKGDPGVGLAFRGKYDAQINYTIDDLVQFDGSLYHCISPSKGNQPVDSNEYWQLWIRGAKENKMLEGYHVTEGQTDTVPIPIDEFDITKDTILVIRQTTVIEKNVEYTFDQTGKNIKSLIGNWPDKTRFYFIVFKYGHSLGNSGINIYVGTMPPEDKTCLWLNPNI